MEVNRQKGFSMTFNVGDRVEKIGGMFAGEFGTVVGYDWIVKGYLVEFEKPHGGMHDGGGKCKNRHGYWCKPNNLRLVEAVDNTKIEIFRNGKAVIALKRTNGKVVAKGVSKCHPDDEFDFDTGARLAMERCVGKADTATTEPESKPTEPKFKKGDTVEFTGSFCHESMPIFFPPVGTKGTVMKAKTDLGNIQVQWEEGSTSEDDCWFTNPNYVRKVSAEPHKFKVGDLVIGNEKANDRYAITWEGWIGRVTEVSDKNFRAVPNINGDWMYSGFLLEYDYFDKYTVDND